MNDGAANRQRRYRAQQHRTGPRLDQSWRADAACKDTDTALFFPPGTTGPAVAQIAAAKAICATCEVRPQCLEYAYTLHVDFGIYGGLTEQERRKHRGAWVRSRRASQAAPRAMEVPRGFAQELERRTGVGAGDA